jgi:hypothetical protein
MTFTNPSIIQDINDLIIGGVNTSEPKVSYMKYKVLVYKRMLKLVVEKVKNSMSLGNDYQAALNEVCEIVYSYLNISEKYFPINEEQVVDEIMKSAQYKNWETEVYYNFLNTHKGVTTPTTPIEAGGEKAELRDAYGLEEQQDIYDLLEALSSSYNL